MQKRGLWLGVALLVCASIHVSSQGTIRGRITDENGESLIGVSVFLKDNNNVGGASDFDGYYSLQMSGGVDHILVFSYLSYETIEDTVRVEDDKVVVRDLVMASTMVSLVEVEVVAKQERHNQYYMENIKKKSASTLDYISGDLMNKIGDNNISAAIGRITGVASNGPFITVRGLGDRYVQTCVNGSLIPTLDPFTNNIRLDLFPSSFVDNIIITKTASPDIQGDWSAAYISIETKDNPDHLSVSIETKVTYTPQTTFKQVINNETSSTDWLGFDNGFRDVNHDKFKIVKAQPTPYEEFCALGLKDYYRSIGVTESWLGGNTLGETYYKLGLVQLGLLGRAYINDPQAVNFANEKYLAGNYRNDAFKIINKQPEESLNDFANNWDSVKKQAPLNFSQTFSIGNQSKLFGQPFSFLAGFRYGNSIQSDANSTFNRLITSNLDSLGNPIVDQRYHQEYAKYTNGWTALVTTNFKIGANNRFSLLFMPNLMGTNSLRKGVDLGETLGFKYAFIHGQFYEERSQLVYQYNSEHFVPSVKGRIQLSASYADGNSSAPDYKRLQFFSHDSINYFLDKTISDVRRNFRYLDENILDTKASFELPLGEKPGYVSKIKLGISFMDRQREALQFDYLLRVANGASINFTNGILNEAFYDERFDIHRDSISGLDKIDLFYTRSGDPADHTVGYSRVYSGFVMLDRSLTEKIRVSGGLRAEYSEIFTDVKKFVDLGYAADDLRRNTDEVSFILTPSNLNQWDFLPSINFIYKIKQDEIYPSNLRLNYSHTIARPSLREYTESIARDFELNSDVFGNAALKFVGIDNYDIRYENYFTSGDYFSVSLFYKNFKNHIELTNSSFGFTWSNAEKSNVYGIELEGRLKLGPRFEFRSNISAVKSYTRVANRSLRIENGVKSWDIQGFIERTMFGQAPFVVNGILNYTSKKGFAASLSYNVQGAKLVLTSIEFSPDIYEMPRHLLNAKITQPLGKHFALNFTIKDIFNTPVRRAYKYDQGFLLDFDQYRYGSEFSLSITYNL